MTTKNRKPLTQDELDETPGDPLPERVAMSLLGGHTLTPAPGGPIVAFDTTPPSAAEPVEDPSIEPDPEQS
jgi:hypothetical protein